MWMYVWALWPVGSENFRTHLLSKSLPGLESRARHPQTAPFQTLYGSYRRRPLAHTSSLDTNLTRNTRAPHFTPQHWLLCHMGLY